MTNRTFKMENAQIAEIFEEIADLLELQQGNRFRIRSYRSAARTARGQSQRLADRVEADGDLTQLPNIGKSTAEKVVEIVHTGSCRRADALRRQVPAGLRKIMNVPQVGPRKAMQLHRRLHIETLAGLKKACRHHRVQKLKGMGRRSEKNILKGIQTVQKTDDRMLLKAASEQVAAIVQHLRQCQHVRRHEVVGSFRRGCETIGDLDFLLVARDRRKAVNQILNYGEINEVIRRGKAHVSIRLNSGLQVDFRFFESSEMGAALVYFTGSKAHNIALRKLAQKRDWKLNEYGLYQGNKRLAGKTESSVYRRLGLKTIPPELRENQGEVERALQGPLPRLIQPHAIRGDLHCHTQASDGENSIHEMAVAAKERGYKYLAITEHSKAVRVAHGLTESRLRKHVQAIRKINHQLKGIALLAGVEVDILKNGKLDLSKKALADLDWVVASIHTHFALGEKAMTKRLLRAIESGVVHCLGHPLGRLISHRNPMKLDLDKIFAACKEHNVAMEINSQPERLDLPASFCRAAREAGVRFAINTDAHSQSGLELMRFGITTARRGWLTKHDVLNTLPAKALLKKLH